MARLLRFLSGLFPRACSGLVLASCSACLLTSSIGVPPPGSVKGYEVRSRIREVVHLNVMMGALGFCAERNHLTDFQCHRLIANDALFAALNAASTALLLVDVDNESFYTPGSVRSCLSIMAVRTLFFTDAYLAGKAECSRTTNTCSLDRKEVRAGAMQAAVVAAPACSLKRTGNVISLENTTL